MNTRLLKIEFHNDLISSTSTNNNKVIQYYRQFSYVYLIRPDGKRVNSPEVAMVPGSGGTSPVHVGQIQCSAMAKIATSRLSEWNVVLLAGEYQIRGYAPSLADYTSTLTLTGGKSVFTKKLSNKATDPSDMEIARFTLQNGKDGIPSFMFK